MYNNPYLNGFMREPQQPITQNFQLAMPNNEMFMARMLNENEKVDEIFINHKTAFISLKDKKLIIKEINGNKTEYGIILPRDEKDVLIDNLQNQINELKGMITNEQPNVSNVSTSDEVAEPNEHGKKSSRK